MKKKKLPVGSRVEFKSNEPGIVVSSKTSITTTLMLCIHPCDPLFCFTYWYWNKESIQWAPFCHRCFRMFLRRVFYKSLFPFPALVHRSEPQNFENYLSSALTKAAGDVRATGITVGSRLWTLTSRFKMSNHSPKSCKVLRKKDFQSEGKFWLHEGWTVWFWLLSEFKHFDFPALWNGNVIQNTQL